MYVNIRFSNVTVAKTNFLDKSLYLFNKSL